MEATSPTQVVAVVQRLEAISRRFDQLQQGESVDDTLSDVLSELPDEIESLVEDIERKIVQCSELRSKLEHASTKAAIEKEVSTKGEDSRVTDPLRQSHTVVRETEQLVDLLFKVTSHTGILGRIPSVSTRGLIGQALKKSCGKIGTVRQARERLREVLRGFEGTCLEASVVSELPPWSGADGGPQKGHSKNVAEAGLRREVRRRNDEEGDAPRSESANENQDWTADDETAGAPHGEPVFVLSPESPSEAPPTPPKDRTPPATSASAPVAARKAPQANRDEQARDQSRLWVVDEERETQGERSSAGKKLTVDASKLKTLKSSLNRWSAPKAYVPSELGDVVEISCMTKENALKVRMRGTWKSRAGKLRSRETVAVDFEGDLDRAKLARCSGKVLIARTIRTGDGQRSAMECLGIIIPVVRSTLVKEELAPFFDASRRNRDGELIEAGVVVERIPLVRADCTIELDRSVPRIYRFPVWLCGDDDVPFFHRIPRMWTAKATGYIAALVALGMGIGYALTRIL